MNEIMRMTQVCMEDRYSKKNINTRIKRDITDDLGNVLFGNVDKFISEMGKYINKFYYKSKQLRVNQLSEKDVEFVVMELLTIVLPMEEWQPIQSAAARLGAKLGYDDVWDGVKTASELLALAAKVDIIDIQLAKDSDTGSIMIKSCYELDQFTKAFIEETKHLPPMVCEPDEVVDNNSIGRLTVNESVISRACNHHSEPQALDVLNILNQIPLSLDERMLLCTEEPSDSCDTAEKLLSHAQRVVAAKKVYAEMIAEGNKFYLTHKFDKRGRVYAQGYHIHTQGNEYKKAIIQLTDKEVIK